MLQHVEQTMREVGLILFHKLVSLWDIEISHFQEVLGSTFAKSFEHPLLNLNKDLQTIAIFGFSSLVFETKSSEERKKLTYYALYWSWHWPTTR